MSNTTNAVPSSKNFPLDEMEAAIRAACAALAGVPGARVSVGGCNLTEAAVEYFARVFPKSSVNRNAYAPDDYTKRPHFIVSFSAYLGGVEVNGQTAAIEMNRDDMERVGRLFSSTTRYLTVDEALRGVTDAAESLPARAWQHHEACPCALRPERSDVTCICDARTPGEVGPPRLYEPQRLTVASARGAVVDTEGK